MSANEKYIDLHVHTNNSDGTFSPIEILNIADSNNTTFLAISDHDSIDGLTEFKNNLLPGMIGVNAIEFSSYMMYQGNRLKLHILGYGFDENNNELLHLLNLMKEKRISSHLNLLKVVKNDLKTLPSESLSKLNMNRYCWFDRELIKCLELEKYPTEIVQLYKNYFKKNKFTYGNDYEVNVADAISAIKSAGGLVVLAHPMSYGFDYNMIHGITYQLTNMGIDGIEIYQSDCSLMDSLFLKYLSEKYKLLYSVGSDFHRIINSDGRIIGKGINDNLCITETTLSNKILEKKKCFRRGE